MFVCYSNLLHHLFFLLSLWTSWKFRSFFNYYSFFSFFITFVSVVFVAQSCVYEDICDRFTCPPFSIYPFFLLPSSRIHCFSDLSCNVFSTGVPALFILVGKRERDCFFVSHSSRWWYCLPGESLGELLKISIMWLPDRKLPYFKAVNWRIWCFTDGFLGSEIVNWPAG